MSTIEHHRKERRQLVLTAPRAADVNSLPYWTHPGMLVALAGCAAGFLRPNFHPAKIHRGDAGSLFLGFVLAVLLLELRANGPTRVPVVVILAIPGLALFDTSLVVISRLCHRTSPFQGGKDHTSHRLVRLGLSVPVAISLLFLVGASLAGVAIGISQLGDTVRIVDVATLVGVGVLASIPMAHIPAYPSLSSRRMVEDPLAGLHEEQRRKAPSPTDRQEPVDRLRESPATGLIGTGDTTSPVPNASSHAPAS